MFGIDTGIIMHGVAKTNGCAVTFWNGEYGIIIAWGTVGGAVAAPTVTARRAAPIVSKSMSMRRTLLLPLPDRYLVLPLITKGITKFSNGR